MATNPFTSAQAGPSYIGGQALTNPEIIALDRQRKMAEMLVKRGMQGQPESEMISGYYVPPSFTQRLSPVVDRLLGQQGLKDVDEKTAKMAEMLRGRNQEQTQGVLNAILGSPARSEEMAGPAFNGVAPTMQFPAVESNPQEALRLALMSESPEARSLLPAIMERALPKQQIKKPMVVSPGGALVNESGQVLYQAPYKPEGGTNIDEDGGYNKKGDWITPNKIFIGKSEVSKDREIAFTADQVRQGLKQISPEDVKKASSVFGNLTGSGPINYLAQQLGNEAVAAQTKINASSVMQILNNLPPGPASDKDIENAKSTFPGYANQKALNDWIKNTRDSLDRKVNSLNQKYGSENWYGNAGLNALSAEDKAALDWANSNPKDPRSAQIKQRLGK
jgi:hypothetical protein